LKVLSYAAFVAAVSLAANTAVGQTPIGKPAAPPQATSTQSTLRIPEGTEVVLRYNDHLSSATSSEGDRFSVTLDEPIVLAGGLQIPSGFRGVGEVTSAEHKGMMGKAGQLNVRLDYLSIGDSRIRLRASKGEQGKDSVGATVALTLLFGPIGLIKHGHDVEIQPGQLITAYVDEPADVPVPVTAPPKS
jgi:hypothetical protein